MSFLDNSMFNFDSMPMNLDHNDDVAVGMSATFDPNSMGAASPQRHQSALGQQNGLGTGAMEVQRYQANQQAEDNAPGGGPPPMTTFGMAQTTQIPGGSTLTEFTKRRNWPAKVVEELKDLLMILDANGRVKHVSPSLTALTGYMPEDIIDKLLRDFTHPDDHGLLVTEFNEAISSGTQMRLFYRLKKKDGVYEIFESVGHAHIAAARFAPNPNNQSPFCQAVFVMSRAYLQQENARLLDSFLEHKMENERLRRRIAELRREEEAETEEATLSWRQSQEGRSDVTPSEDTCMTPLSHTTSFYRASDAAAMPPPERPSALNTGLTRENLEGVTAGSRPDSIRDKMARYEGTHVDTIERLTGLRYQEGERSRGITTGNASPTLIKGDAGIAIPMDRDPRTGEKKKKLKVAEEYVCTDCGKFARCLSLVNMANL
ncbi:white collar 2 type of transcription factor [Cytospora paraplurivora]|uniref:White collar 2 type of transcription factor n=1 Tax=Cytospora paraplurivora TaxID=2898453 RepID=A0AAN9U9M2_9PEZI